jgi:hypothetical protein
MKIFGKEIGKDKWDHFHVGIAIGFISSAFFTLFTYNVLILGAIGVGVTLIAALGKELIWDKMLGKGTPEFLDVLFTVCGGILGAAITIGMISLM